MGHLLLIGKQLIQVTAMGLRQAFTIPLPDIQRGQRINVKSREKTGCSALNKGGSGFLPLQIAVRA